MPTVTKYTPGVYVPGNRTTTKPLGEVKLPTLSSLPTLPTLPVNPTEEQMKQYQASMANYNASLSDSMLSLLPSVLSRLNQKSTPQFTLPAFRSEDISTVPERVSASSVFKNMGLNPGERMYKGVSFVAGPSAKSSAYTAAPALSAVLKDIKPQLDEYTANLRGAQSEFAADEQKRMADLFASRGILGSGAEVDAVKDLSRRLASEFDRSRSDELRRLVENQQSLGAQEAARKTSFGQAENRFITDLLAQEASRKQDAAFRDALASSESGENALSRLLDIGKDELASRRSYNEGVAGINRRNLAALREYEKEGTDLLVKNDALERERFSRALSDALSLFSGVPSSGGGNTLSTLMSSAVSDRSLAESRRQADEANRLARDKLMGSYIGTGVSALPGALSALAGLFKK